MPDPLWQDSPCDACGKDTGCTCPPCDCRWCRYERGEATPDERRIVEAHVYAHKRARDRQALRASAGRMQANIDQQLKMEVPNVPTTA